MKVYWHRSDYGKVGIRCYDTKDLMSDKKKFWCWSKHWKDWETFFGPYYKKISGHDKKRSKKYNTERFIRAVLNEFFTLLMEDLILHNDSYQFPRKLGSIQISYEHPLSAKYVYNIDRQGKNYRPVFVFTKHAYDKVKVQYYFSTTRRWRAMLKKEILKGHTYELAKYEHTNIVSDQHDLSDDC
jgi:hypothetical protein